MKNKKHANVQKKTLLVRPAGSIVYVSVAKSLMQFSEIALSALHVEKVMQRQSKAVVANEIHKISLNVGCCNLFILFSEHIFIYQ